MAGVLVGKLATFVEKEPQLARQPWRRDNPVALLGSHQVTANILTFGAVS